jgi:hypothetical protein
LTGALVLAFATVAFAAVTNTYTVTASVSPTKAGSKSKPVPIGLHFNYQVGEAAGQRPSVITGYSILFSGIATHGEDFPKCPAAQINATGDDSSCKTGASKGSEVGSGNVENIAGATNNPADQSQKCHLDLTLYNGGKGRLAIFLKGAPSPAGPSDPKNCPLTIGTAIDAKYVKKGGGTALEFTVPPILGHPIANFDNAVVTVASSVKKLVSKKDGHGYFDSVGGCKAGKRTISVTFTPESGGPGTATTTTKCTA